MTGLWKAIVITVLWGSVAYIVRLVVNINVVVVIIIAALVATYLVEKMEENK